MQTLYTNFTRVRLLIISCLLLLPVSRSLAQGRDSLMGHWVIKTVSAKGLTFFHRDRPAVLLHTYYQRRRMQKGKLTPADSLAVQKSAKQQQLMLTLKTNLFTADSVLLLNDTLSTPVSAYGMATYTIVGDTVIYTPYSRHRPERPSHYIYKNGRLYQTVEFALRDELGVHRQVAQMEWIRKP